MLDFFQKNSFNVYYSIIIIQIIIKLIQPIYLFLSYARSFIPLTTFQNSLDCFWTKLSALISASIFVLTAKVKFHFCFSSQATQRQHYKWNLLVLTLDSNRLYFFQSLRTIHLLYSAVYGDHRFSMPYLHVTYEFHSPLSEVVSKFCSIYHSFLLDVSIISDFSFFNCIPCSLKHRVRFIFLLQPTNHL